MRGKEEEKQKKRVRTIQTAMWAGLILVQMTVVNSLTVQAAESVPVEKIVTYRQVEGAASVPESLEVMVWRDGAAYPVDCKAAEKTVTKEYWTDDFIFPVTFHSYDSQYFQIGEKLVPYNAERPGLENCGPELLALMGLSPEEYEVASVVWGGAAYRNEAGVLCRDARGAGKRLVRDYEVRYVGSLALPEETGGSEDMEIWPEEAVLEEEEKQETATAETIQGAAAAEISVGILEEPEEVLEKSLTLWQIITRTMLVIVGIGALLFFGGLLALLIRRIKSRWKQP